MDGEEIGRRGARRGRALRGSGHQHPRLLDGGTRGAQQPRSCVGRHARPLDHPGPHRLHLARRPVRAHARHESRASRVRGPARAPRHRPRGAGHDPLRRRHQRVRGHHGRGVHRIRARAQSRRRHRAHRAVHPRARGGEASCAVRRDRSRHVQREPRLRPPAGHGQPRRRVHLRLRRRARGHGSRPRRAVRAVRTRGRGAHGDEGVCRRTPVQHRGVSVRRGDDARAVHPLRAHPPRRG